MEPLKENSVLQTITRIFNSYVYKEKHDNPEIKSLPKKNIFQIFFDYNIMDTCGYNILHINEFLHQLAPVEEEEIIFYQFLQLIFFIYQVQINPNFDEDIEVNDITIEEINNISDNRKEIANTMNIINIFLDDYENGKKFFKFCTPDCNNQLIKQLLNYEMLDQISKYMYAFNENIFLKYSKKHKDKQFIYMDISKLNPLFTKNNISAVFTGKELVSFVQIFTRFEIKSESTREDFAEILEQPMNELQIISFFENKLVSIRELNFTYSSILLLMALLSLQLKSTEGTDNYERIKFFFEEIINLRRDDVDPFSEKKEKVVEPEKKDDSIQDSEKLNLQKAKTEYDKDDYEFINEFFLTFDKVLPPVDENMLSFSNSYITPNKKIFTDIKQENIPKFPVEKLYVEVVEQNERDLSQKESLQIQKAKKKKKDQKKTDENPYHTVMGELLNEQAEEKRYVGHERLDILTSRIIKKTMKEILPNTRMYPTIIKELLTIPTGCTQRCMELIVECFEDKMKGHLEQAIKRLEKAQDLLPKDRNNIDWQVELFFNLTFGSLYESLDYDLVAMKYYLDSFHISEKLITLSPDNALVFCYLGEFFVKIKEFQWALRAYLKARKIREETIGGDTIDSATIYNNLGVVAFCLESYLPANGYFQLAYEIYKNILGLNNPRTLMIKENLTKLRNLNFNKQVEFKTLSKFATPAQLMTNPKKKKK